MSDLWPHKALSAALPRPVEMSLGHPSPNPLQIFIADHRTTILATTVVGHLAHWNYLTRYRRLDPASKANRRQFGRLGLAWGLVYVSVLSAITISMRDVKATSDALLRTRYP
jgi:hypothetical protein